MDADCIQYEANQIHGQNEDFKFKTLGRTCQRK